MKKKSILIYILSEVIFIIIFIMSSIMSYPIIYQDINNYIEKHYGSIKDKVETNGSYICRYTNQNHELYIIVLNRNFFVKNRFNINKNTNCSNFEVKNQYEILEIQNEDVLKVDILKETREEKINQYVLGFLLLNLSLITLFTNRMRFKTSKKQKKGQ
ncbi:hypothetical protein LQE92_10945 [Lacrimispora sp. NSJ-141]|uniref:Uncharacterized protein n=1 Tax=Lientehia hominis TaxID=2897778 RepID=A0AAP2WAF9_9FIRM|nr:hypothetical protein [Lientehia hominis]MCD2493134.1 hypothetical protein [Lientehia hominis]